MQGVQTACISGPQIRSRESTRLHVIDAVMIFRENIRPEWEDFWAGVR